MKRHRYKPWNAPDAEIKAKNKADVLILLHVVKEKNLEINKKKKLSRKRNYKNEIKEISEVGTTVSEKKNAGWAPEQNGHDRGKKLE